MVFMVRCSKRPRAERFAQRLCEWVVFIWVSAIVLGAAVPACLLVFSEAAVAHAHASADASGNALFHEHEDSQDSSHCRVGEPPAMEAEASASDGRLLSAGIAVLDAPTTRAPEPPVPRRRAPDLSMLSVRPGTPVHALLGRLLN